jgi:polyferredoxin
LAGWVESGVPPSASVLTVLTAIAVAAPITTKRNVYCSHLCAHGAAQQVLKQIARPKRSPPRWLRPWLIRLPFAIFAFAILAVALRLPVNLVDLEPFDGYLLGVAGVAALAIFALSLMASLCVPMAYCRYGCPTGAFLDYVRLNRQSNRFSWRDAVLLCCLLIAAARYGEIL